MDTLMDTLVIKPSVAVPSSLLNMNTEEKPPQKELSESKLHELIAANVDVIRLNQNAETGAFPATDGVVEGRSDVPHHYEEAWLRDEGLVMEGLVSAYPAVRDTNPELAQIMADTCRDGVTKTLDLFASKPERWITPLQQRIETVQEGEATYTRLTAPAAEVHFKTNGEGCKGGGWDHNQPEAWADYLFPIVIAKREGIISEYTPAQMQTIRTIVDYLIKIEPWHFEGSSMWEGVPVRNPASRSNALIIAKALDHSKELFPSDSELQDKIDQTVTKTMEFVRGESGEGIFTDYTASSGHPDGTDLAMMVALSMPDTPATSISILEFLPKADKVLKSGDYPGSIRYIGDDYYQEKDEEGTKEKDKRGKGETEAVWFMGKMLRASGYFQEAARAEELGLADVAGYLKEQGWINLNQIVAIAEKYKYYPELFMQKRPDQVSKADNATIVVDPHTQKKVALVPNANDLLWNRALAIKSAALALRWVSGAQVQPAQIGEVEEEQRLPLAA